MGVEENVPKLRFPQFTKCWENHKLGEIAKFSKGKGVSKNDITAEGVNECIRYGELYTRYAETIRVVFSKTNLAIESSVISEVNDVIIPASGESQIDIATASCVLKSGVILGGDLNIIKTDNNGVFLSYYLNNKKKKDIANLAQGISVVHLYSSQLSLLKLNLPEKEEQTKIASFLTAVDDKLQALKKKKELLEQYKKGMMQQLFSQEIRFKKDDGTNYPDWEDRKLRNTIEMIVDNRGKTPPTVEEGIPLIEVNSIGNINIEYSKVSKFVTVETYNKWFRKYLKDGDILFSTVGNTAICSYYRGKNKACIAQNIVGLRFKNDYSLFMYYLLIEEKNNSKFKQIQMGAVQPSIKVSQMIDLFFEIPSFEEQIKIANFLSAIDDKIAHCQSELDGLEQWKKGLLQQLFC